MLTLLRVFLTLFFIYFLYQDGLLSKIMALIVFILASLTDFFDGYYARKHAIITRFGKIMDPIADKFLMLSAFFIFMQMHLIAAWMFFFIFAREIIVTGLRLLAVGKGRALAAEGAGKIKTVLQIAAVYLIMISIVLAQLDVNGPWYANAVSTLAGGSYIFMIGVVLVTVWSGISFLWNNRKGIFSV